MELAISKPEAQDLADGQYSLAQILGIWAAVTLPMPILGFVVTPLLGRFIDMPLGFVFFILMTVGLVWQLVLTLLVLKRELGALSWRAIQKRLWIQHPRNPKTGQKDIKQWWMIFPALVVGVVLSLLVSGWAQFIPALLPFLTPVEYGNTANMITPEFAPYLLGQWWVFALVVFSAMFNFFLGEEFIFRGLLLPKMNGVFGKWDWVANGALFAFYHIHLYWNIVPLVLLGVAISGFTKRYRSIWFGAIMHGFMPMVGYYFLLAVIAGWMTF